ncbi:hypothetical protein Lal_00020880 [Lupinus albus]|uniref:Putative Prolamin-like domain-containing protein n=1 Tax=Lupinus albus TaxID=3870 RepID=A0A6A5MAX5_LUPAL|nr:putative Prolamin-like domain-containing protein [Lupinus albus]KAF1871146.1 hypothetical protein Lal_00020880 [Lupinus albus]
MATSCNLCVVLVFMFSHVLLIQTGFSYEHEAPQPEPDFDAPSPLTSEQKYLFNCVSNLNPSCGQDIFYVLLFGNKTLSSDCCSNLVNDVGKICHDDLVKNMFTSSKFKSKETLILENSEKLWNECLLFDVDAESPTSSIS